MMKNDCKCDFESENDTTSCSSTVKIEEYSFDDSLQMKQILDKLDEIINVLKIIKALM